MKKEASKKKRDEAKKSGICIDCFKQPSVRGKSRCDSCLSARKKQASEKRAGRIKEGICPVCGNNPFFPPSTICQPCQEATKIVRNERGYARMRTRQKKELGLCVSCGKHPTNGKNLCLECAGKTTNTAKKRKKHYAESDRCTVCGKSPLASKLFCQECLVKYRLRHYDKQSEKIDAGICICCTRPATLMNRHCEICLLKNIARKIWKDSSRWTELQELYDKQDGLCPYLGESIQIGTNASIDHRTPTSRGGSNEIDNLQWINYHVNMMKWILTHEEFMDLVGRIKQRAE